MARSTNKKKASICLPFMSRSGQKSCRDWLTRHGDLKAHKHLEKKIAMLTRLQPSQAQYEVLWRYGGIKRQV